MITSGRSVTRYVNDTISSVHVILPPTPLDDEGVLPPRALVERRILECECDVLSSVAFWVEWA